MERQETAILVSIGVLVLLCVIIIFLFVIFQKSKNKLLQKQKNAQKQFEKELAETQIEIREQTLRNISWELHDNIGQLLTLAKIQLQVASKSNFEETQKTISKALLEVRALSKLINPDILKDIKLCEAIQLEIDRFNRLNFIKSELKIVGNPLKLDPKIEIILFRILQEFFSNTIKHSKATTLNVNLNYKINQLHIVAQDNGVGFDSSLNEHNGIGLQNIKNRAKLINADINVSSEINKGTILKIIHYF